jgi:L-threonylcarbamoyladenylate synthase
VNPVPLWRWSESPTVVATVLRRGGVVAIPTESSYGLAVDPCNPEGVARVYRLKRRDAGKPLPVVAADVEQLIALGLRLRGEDLDPLVALWPAPLTLVVPLASSRGSGVDSPTVVAIAAAAGGDTLAVRVPDHPRLRRLLAQVGPVTATSANVSGAPPVLDPEAARSLLARLGAEAARMALVIDDGTLPGGLPSTLVAPPGKVLRRGRFPLEALPLDPTESDRIGSNRIESDRISRPLRKDG